MTLLLEASPNQALTSMILWPQVVFTLNGPVIRGDLEELQVIGADPFQKVFVRQLLGSFRSLKSKRPRLIFEQIKRPPVGYTYPPRAFASRRVDQFDSKMHFQLRYLTSADKRRALNELDRWGASESFDQKYSVLGSPLPVFKLHYEAVALLRALVKIGINLLSHICEKTEVNHRTFGNAVQFVMGAADLSVKRLHEFGFTYAADVSALRCPSDAHQFRLIYDARRGMWALYCAFFSGKLGAFICFPGTSREDWSTVDVIVPLGSPKWQIDKTVILQPLKFRVEWKDLTKVIPALRCMNLRCAEFPG